MKHFNAQTGGRYTFVDDIINLQELALAFNSIFTDCDNFIVSGCEVSGSSISSGFVYINGELRHFQGTTGISTWPQYIYESNSVESVSYASGSSKVGRNVYGCGVSQSVPSALDALTNAVPQFIKVTENGALRLKDALFGKYALLLNSANGVQDVMTKVNFKNDVAVSGIFTANKASKVVSGDCVGEMFWDNENFVIQTRVSNGKNFKLVFNKTTGFVFYVNDEQVFSISESGIVTPLKLVASGGLFGGKVAIAGDSVYENESDTDNGALKINMVGYNGATSKYRNTYIGNGKGNAIISVIGAQSEVQINGSAIIASTGVAGLIIKSLYEKTSSSMLKAILFRDTNDDGMANIGYVTSGSKIFTIANLLGSVGISATDFVDIGPAIKEGGQLLSTKYVLKTAYNAQQLLKANLSEVYTRTQATNLFAGKSAGLSQFIVGSNTAAVLRSQIGACGQGDVKNLCPTLANHLSDMAKTESDKAKIRRNIGAAAASDSYEPIVTKTGWKVIEAGWLWAKQIGNIVCIQGRIHSAKKAGQVQFTLPTGISSPGHYVGIHCHSDGDETAWTAKIENGSRDCIVLVCDSAKGESFPITVTYMV